MIGRSASPAPPPPVTRVASAPGAGGTLLVTGRRLISAEAGLGLRRAAGHASSLRGSTSVRTKLLTVGLLAMVGAALVGFESARNPNAAPASVAVPLRLLIIGVLVLSGMFAYASRGQRPMGRLLMIMGLFSCLWLLNGSREEPEFGIGLVAAGLAPGLFCFLTLAFPSGRIKGRGERCFLLSTTAVMALVWLVAIPAHRAPIVRTPLLRAASSGSTWLSQDAHDLLAWTVRVDWLIMGAGTAFFLARRAKRSNHHTRLLMAPMVAIVAAQASLLTAFILADAFHAPSTNIRTAYVATATALPLALFVGLAMQRLSLGRVLAGFVTALGSASARDVQSAMASTLNDPELSIFYARDGSTRLVDAHGVALPQAERDGRRRTRVQSGGRTLAVVDFDDSLSDQQEYIQATAKSAVLWLEHERLERELATSKSSLEASRARLASTADLERRRIQRDLHDGAQQHLIGMHMKLELAVEAMQDERARCASLLAEIGEELGQTATDLRSLAANVFPPTLSEHGLLDALASAARRMGIHMRLETFALSRHRGEIETQLYFVYLEALQNVRKHAGPDAEVTLRIWEVKRYLYVELRDTGSGFDPAVVERGAGLSNMQARVSALHGHLTVTSTRGIGATVRAVVPIRRPKDPPSPSERHTRSGDPPI